jgi:uncharacterized membrane protein
VFVAAFAFIFFVTKRDSDDAVIAEYLVQPFGLMVAAVGAFAFYNIMRIEIGNYFYLLAMRHEPPLSLNWLAGSGLNRYDLARFNAVAQINYTTFFLIVMSVVNLRKIRSVIAGAANSALGVISLAFTATGGMFLLYELRMSYLSGETVGLFGSPLTNVVARPFTYVISAGALLMLYQYVRDSLFDPFSTRELRALVFDAVCYSFILIVASCELMNVAAHLHVKDADKYGLSILWGIFALVVIVIGIAKARKHLRIGSIVLLAVTLMKLFFYDITELGTIPKTILFISLGVLLLLISFLYNKYKNVIFGTDEIIS